jgi:hypothetical protein
MATPIDDTASNDRNVTGRDATLKVGTTEVPISNVSFDREVDTTDVQLNDSLKPTHVVTGLRFSGSFEYDGSNTTLEEILFSENATDAREAQAPIEQATLTVTEELDAGKRTYTFKNVIVTSQSRDLPSDDVMSTSYDFIAEDLTVTRP